MPAKIIDGKKIAEQIREEIAHEVSLLKKRSGIVPGLAAILIGDNEASGIYVRNKKIACKKAGMVAEQYLLPAASTEREVLLLIEKLNHNPGIHGILVQLPLPKQIDERKILEAVLPEKDIDGFHPFNMGKLLAGCPTVLPCTPFGVIRMLEAIDCKIEGKEAVVVGRSNIVGKPVSLLLMQRNATVTVCHTRTANLAEKVGRADILIAAAGRPEMVKGDWIKKGAVVIDVGINRLADGRLVGDVEFGEAQKRAGWITPVPGGVGPMTIAMLLWNTLQSAKRTLPA
ncbi:MAG: bifunctional methylenetetrahydrofolate dehydrogenase/methenyltetrahydrofolate cyclohydrolase FolD [Deltaproteobacteria bacterium]|nr:bifunctional methylenetetrahydrofolate dehydrogenase/methenyltetrahydrofolate cyclohydrolase FolD [Deltaproteobacteria bacterium]